MKLIEQLGGYEAAKKFLDESNGSAWSGIFYMPKLKQSLLEHRRQHNIFEVGDKVVLSNMHSFNTIHTVKRVENLTPRIKGSEVTYFLDNSLGVGCSRLGMQLMKKSKQDIDYKNHAKGLAI